MKRSEIIFASLGIAGPMIGLLVGYYTAVRVLETQLEHADRTRYQEQRLETYTTFLDRATVIVVIGRLPRPLAPVRLQRWSKTLPEFNILYTRLNLSAGPEVRKLAAELHGIVSPFIQGKVSPEQAQPYTAYSAKLRDVMRAMRTELGTEGAIDDADQLLSVDDVALDDGSSAAPDVIDR